MIKRLYIDNYKCFVNFEVEFEQLNLILGKNGAGKTTLFEVIKLLNDLIINGERANSLFSEESLTRWDRRAEQKFELEMEGNAGKYLYTVTVEHNPSLKEKVRIFEERLLFDSNLIFAFNEGKVQLYQDSYQSGPAYHFDWSGSALSSVGEYPNNRKLRWFRDRLRNIYPLRINPYEMEAGSKEENDTPAPDLHNFASWYRHLSQEHPEALVIFFNDLKEVIEGFISLRLIADGERARSLVIEQNIGSSDANKHISFGLNELSDGQRVLIVLYAILRFGMNEDTTFLLDEAENHVGLSEIEPWLSALSDRCEEKGAQAFLVSHSPEVLNSLAVENGILLKREKNGPVRAQRFAASLNNAPSLTAAELIARGWEDA